MRLYIRKDKVKERERQILKMRLRVKEVSAAGVESYWMDGKSLIQMVCRHGT